MPAYHQMGHDSENLLPIDELSSYAGAILSPVNYNLDEVKLQIDTHKAKGNFELIFDPQLYDPKSNREILRQWDYFPGELDTADLSSFEWWSKVNARLTETLKRLSPHAVCSPAAIPRAYSNAYYDAMTAVSNDLSEACEKLGIGVLQTVLVNFHEIAEKDKALSIASIVSKTKTGRVYLIFVGDTEPRRELDDAESLKGGMRLIHELEQSGLKVTVGFSSSDMILWKAAGASSCATGKFFNLRRFTKSRFEEPQGGGGGQLPYWHEESLAAFLRESDVLRIQREQLFSDSTLRNPFGTKILEKFKSEPGKAWLALAWRQYLWWFADCEQRISRDPSSVKTMLRSSEKIWEDLEDKDVLMEESRNDGRWIRTWRRALAEYLNA